MRAPPGRPRVLQESIGDRGGGRVVMCRKVMGVRLSGLQVRGHGEGVRVAGRLDDRRWGRRRMWHRRSGRSRGWVRAAKAAAHNVQYRKASVHPFIPARETRVGRRRRRRRCRRSRASVSLPERESKRERERDGE